MKEKTVDFANWSKPTSKRSAGQFSLLRLDLTTTTTTPDPYDFLQGTGAPVKKCNLYIRLSTTLSFHGDVQGIVVVTNELNQPAASRIKGTCLLPKGKVNSFQNASALCWHRKLRRAACTFNSFFSGEMRKAEPSRKAHRHIKDIQIECKKIKEIEEKW